MRHRDELRAVRGALGRLGRYDLVCCIDDGLNYLLHDAELVLALGGMAAQLRRGALVLFDLNTLATYRGFFATETVVSTRSHDLCWRGLATAAFAPGQVARARLDIVPRAGGRPLRTLHRQRHHTPAVGPSCGAAGEVRLHDRRFLIRLTPWIIQPSIEWRGLGLERAPSRLRGDRPAVRAHGIDVDDIVQETLVRAWRKRGQCRAVDDPLPWVGRIAHNEGRRHWSKSGREVLLADPAPEVNSEPPGEGLAALLDGLREGERIVVELRYVHDQTHQAIAGQLGMPVGTVKARLHRARHRLKEVLANVDD